MKIFAIVLANTLPIICVLSSVYLIMNEKNGWGWLVFLAVLTSHTWNGPKEGE